MGRRARKIITLLTSAALLGLVAQGRTAQAADILPRTDFPICSTERNTYCIAEVTFIEIEGEKPGVWTPTGTPITDTAGTAVAATFPTFEKVPYAGRYSYPGFNVARGYDGVYVRVGPANEYTDTMMIAIEPAGTGADGRVARVKDEATGKVASLAADMAVRVSVRLGSLIPALTVGVSNTAEVNKTCFGWALAPDSR